MKAMFKIAFTVSAGCGLLHLVAYVAHIVRVNARNAQVVRPVDEVCWMVALRSKAVKKPDDLFQLVLFEYHPRMCPVETPRSVVVNLVLDGRENAKIVAGPSQSPEEVGVRLGRRDNEAAIGENYASLENLVC